jgi:Lon protease-like protein
VRALQSGVSDETAIQVNFGRAIPLFPLDAPVLLPQQVLPLHIFEPRYRQMIEHALDGAGQIAMAVFAGDAWKEQYHGRPPLKPAVCVGHILQHERLSDGRYNVLLQGVCRARMVREVAPEEQEGKLYRTAQMEPVGLETPDPEVLGDARRRIGEMLSEAPLNKLTVAEPVLEWVNNDDIPAGALLELVSFAVVNEPRLKYRLLAEGNAHARVQIILGELTHLTQLARRAAAQHPEEWPKGCSWN